MANQKTDDKAKAGLNKKVLFATTLLLGILFGYKTATAYGLSTSYMLALSALGTLGLWSSSLLVVSIIEANRELNTTSPTLERMQAKLEQLQASGKVPKIERGEQF